MERFRKWMALPMGLTALALGWLLAQGDHIHAIPGTTSVEHLRENFAAAALDMSPDLLSAAGEIVNQGSVSGHRYPEVMRNTIDTEDYT